MIITGTIAEGSDIYVVARVETPNQAIPLSGGAADTAVTSVTLNVYDIPTDSPEVLVYTAALTAANCFKAALTVDGYWTQDTTGFNFFNRILATAFEQHGGHRVRCEYSVLTPNFGIIAVDALVTIEPRYSS